MPFYMITAIILAAGEAKRMGRIKQLLPWGRSTVLETVISQVANCKYIDDEVRVVLGAYQEKISPVLRKWEQPGLRVMINNNYQQGMLSSIHKGVEGLPEETEYLMFFLGDKPMITTELINSIALELLKRRPEIMVPVFKGQRGHPVIITTALLPEVYQLTGPGGLRSLLQKYPERVYSLEVANRGITVDIDYYEDYLKLRKNLDYLDQD
ncbi:MAG: molybdenum cofactor cytidylyltransferase [Halanaerobiales bacterium]|nr:molybdenum cofactor cytidylyltransferase [Halanaerobiales bacterium]